MHLHLAATPSYAPLPRLSVRDASLPIYICWIIAVVAGNDTLSDRLTRRMHSMGDCLQRSAWERPLCKFNGSVRE